MCDQNCNHKNNLNLSNNSSENSNEILLERHSNIKDELLCHLPIAIFSVAFSMVVLSFLSYNNGSSENMPGAHKLFHGFHFMHLLFASTGTVLTFKRFSRNAILAVILGFFIPAVFCTLSDAILPYFVGQLFNIDMHFHWCFITELKTVLPFLIVGMINGWVMSKHASNKHLFYSQGFHFLHIFISSMAAILYLVSFGFAKWWKQMGIVFILLILIVLIPCTLSDIVVPIFFAQHKKD